VRYLSGMAGFSKVVLLIALSTVAGIALPSADAASGGGSRLVRASATFMRLGRFQIGRAATYANALESLGPSSSCWLPRNGTIGSSADHAIAEWKPLGVRIELRTYAALPDRRDGCTAPAAIHVSTIRITGHQWYTSRGLRVGDPVAKLQRRYRAARAADDLPGWYHHGYWLVTRPLGGYEGVGGLRPTAPVLVAETSNGRVLALVFVVDGEGD